MSSGDAVPAHGDPYDRVLDIFETVLDAVQTSPSITVQLLESIVSLWAAVSDLGTHIGHNP